MKKSTINYLLIAALSMVMVFAFGACGGSSDDNGGSTESGTVPTEVVSDYDTVVYSYTDNSDETDLYSVKVTFEYDGDKVMGVTTVTTDDMSAEDDEDIFQMHLNDYDGILDDTGFKDMDGFTWDVSVNGKVRTETLHYDMTQFDVNAYKKHIGIEDDNDYVSLEALTAVYEAAGFTKEEAEQ